ncbi:predicted protein [Naegleria gruberi]|uniref:Sodium/hydrogen exchanger n=1 Tax=Naegleria gruberi TaxID=5762 RepID=D2VLD5_NAEGR|nr:uncharacterized protein NAEGRDRAFT_69741 [Naegleria gruberi]EFC42370.1 predicted protein [Naegleria gruberi]|eukprot:XP_002675114.1 predicted protein [Naegleria gruberi strain NEG-M]
MAMQYSRRILFTLVVLLLIACILFVQSSAVFGEEEKPATEKKPETTPPQPVNTSNESRQESVNVFLITATMLVIIFATYFFLQFKINFLPDSIITIAIGMIMGLVISYFGIESGNIFKLESDIFFLFLLPPIIFESGYNLSKGNFFGNIISILWYAIAGTIISTLVIGIGIGIFGIIPWIDSFAFASLISSVDPIAALTVFSGIKEDFGEKRTGKISILVFGESTLNDVAAMLLFRSFDTYARFPSAKTISFSSSAISFMNHLLLSFFGSLIIGVVIALLSALIFKYLQFYKYPSLEITLMVITSVLPYFLSEGLELSGILALLSSSIVNSHYTRLNLSKKTSITIDQALMMFSYICETIVFLYLGLATFTYTHRFHFGMIFLAIILCILGRIANIFPITYILNNFFDAKISKNSQLILTWCGMRGVISLALALSLTETEYKNTIVTTTLVVVLLSILVFGGGISPLIRYLYRNDTESNNSNTPTREIPTLDHNEEESSIDKLDKEYFLPFFTTNDPNRSEVPSNKKPIVQMAEILSDESDDDLEVSIRPSKN